MSKLNDIEIALSHGWAHGRSKAEVNWLITRVRKLEAALNTAEERLCHLYDTDRFGTSIGTSTEFVFKIRNSMRDALKED